MVKHVILWKLKDELAGEEKEQVKAGIKEGLEGLAGQIPGLIEVKVRTECLPSSTADVMLDTTFDSVEADYLVAKSNYEKAASDVNDTVITTPISGYIIGKPTPVGQTISSGISTPQVIMSVATLDNMEIEALVDESDIGQVKDGQKVKFTVDAYPNETFTGKVRLISRSATTENNVIYYKVYVTVDDAKGKLLPTMTARTEIIIDEANDVTIVPLNCVYSEGNRRYVKVYNEKTKETRDVDVKLGLTSDSEVAVTATGLSIGDKLLVKKAVSKQSSNRMGPPPMH